MTEMGVAGYGEQPSWEVSHGESYLQAILAGSPAPASTCWTRPKALCRSSPPSPLLYQLQDLVEREDAQVIYSTHSPMVVAIPGAQIMELTDSGIAERKWDELEMVHLWRSFLGWPEKFFDA